VALTATDEQQVQHLLERGFPDRRDDPEAAFTSA
jgi:hypothetical protein